MTDSNNGGGALDFHGNKVMPQVTILLPRFFSSSFDCLNYKPSKSDLTSSITVESLEFDEGYFRHAMNLWHLFQSRSFPKA